MSFDALVGLVSRLKLLVSSDRPVADWTADCRWFTHDGCADTSDVKCLRNVSAEAVLEAVRQVIVLIQKTRTLARAQ